MHCPFERKKQDLAEVQTSNSFDLRYVKKNWKPQIKLHPKLRSSGYKPIEQYLLIFDCFRQIHLALLISDWCAKIYGAWKYGEDDQNPGWEKVIAETSMLDLTGNENNHVTSVRVNSGCQLKLFDHHNNSELLESFVANGDFCDDDPCSGNNDRASSLSCTCPTGRVKELLSLKM